MQEKSEICCLQTINPLPLHYKNVMDLIILLSALLPALLLFLYIWKKDPQKEPTSQLVKAVLWGIGICIPVAFLELAINGIYDALAMSGIVNPYIGAAAFSSSSTSALRCTKLPEQRSWL